MERTHPTANYSGAVAGPRGVCGVFAAFAMDLLKDIFLKFSFFSAFLTFSVGGTKSRPAQSLFGCGTTPLIWR